jgi:ribosomal protein S18 acetylase RimI-like enzyme
MCTVDNTHATPPVTGDGGAADRVTLRRIRADDWARQRALRLEMLADTPIAYLESLQNARARSAGSWMTLVAERTASSTSAQWVLDTGERFAGTMSCVLDETGRVHVVAVYLSPAYRGHGLLDRMLDAVVQWARERAVTTLVLEVARENDRAVAAYRRLGFAPTGHTHRHPLYPEITEVEMTRSVDHS